MSRTRLIRRSVRAALTTSRHVVRAAVSSTFRLLTRLYAAIDEQATLRITYTDETGAHTVRDIQPRSLRATDAGRIVCTAHDLLRQDRRDFRTDRMTLIAT